jgi:hypothetical protein
MTCHWAYSQQLTTLLELLLELFTSTPNTDVGLTQ